MSDPPSESSSAAPIRADNLEFVRKQAKALLRAYRRGDQNAQQRIAGVFPRQHGVPSRARIGLAEAQLALARELGFASWQKLVRQFGGNHTHGIGEQTMTTIHPASTNNLGLSAIDQISLACTDLDEAQRFYCDVLGLRFGGEALPTMKFFDCAGINIVMFKGDTVAPGSVIYFRVEGVPVRIQEKFEQLKSMGVKVEQEPRCITKGWFGHDVWLAFFKDPFGNLLSLKSDVPVTK